MRALPGRGSGLIASRRFVRGETIFIDRAFAIEASTRWEESAGIPPFGTSTDKGRHAWCAHCFLSMESTTDIIDRTLRLRRSKGEWKTPKTIPPVYPPDPEADLDCAECGVRFCSPTCKSDAETQWHGVTCTRGAPQAVRSGRLKARRELFSGPDSTKFRTVCNDIDYSDMVRLVYRVIASELSISRRSTVGKGGLAALTDLLCSDYAPNDPLVDTSSTSPFVVFDGLERDAAAEGDPQERSKRRGEWILALTPLLHAALGMTEEETRRWNTDAVSKCLVAVLLNCHTRDPPTSLATILADQGPPGGWSDVSSTDDLPLPLFDGASDNPHHVREDVMIDAWLRHGSPGGRGVAAFGPDEWVSKAQEAGAASRYIREARGSLVELGYSARATAVFPFGFYCNHDCHPNAASRYLDVERIPGNVLKVVALRNIEVGDEVCISYIDEQRLTDVAERRAALRHRYGFTCACARCQADEAVLAAESPLGRRPAGGGASK